MSKNPGRGIHSWMGVLYSCVSALWVGVASELFTGVVVVGFAHPMPLVILNAPLSQALWFWLQLHFWESVGSTGSDVLRDVIFTQFEGIPPPKTSVFINIVSCSLAFLSSHTHSANWCGSSGIGGQAFSAQCCNALVYARVFCGCFIQ